MNETQARHAMLVRAYETAPPGDAHAHWGEADRDWATRAAQEVEGEHASADAFIARRATLASERLQARDRAADRALRALAWRPWFGWTLALAALVGGFAADAIGASGRINLLSPPLFALIAWNLAVYVLLAIRGTRTVARGERVQPGPVAHMVARASHAVVSAQRLARESAVLASFVTDWLAASATLTAARVARVVHLAAAGFAVGAVAGMYIRGLGLAYLAGWESTFLEPDTVRAILSTLLAPASMLTGIAVPDAAHIAAIRFDTSPGENAARWIHLYAATLALAVLVPRLLLTVANRWRERRLERRFPLPLDAPYFAALAIAHSGLAASARIVPYSYRLAPQAAIALDAMLGRLFGAQSHASIASAIEFGGEDALDASVVGDGLHLFVAALFPATATPEPETHGAFVQALARLVPAQTPMLVLVDESPFLDRFGRDGGADARRDERRIAWTRMLAAQGRAPVFIDPVSPDATGGMQALKSALERDAARPLGHDAARPALAAPERA